MKKVLICLLSLIMIALIFGCAADIILEEPEPLDGYYKGEYIYLARGAGGEEDTSIQRIIWGFDAEEENYYLHIDFDHPDFDISVCICETHGQFSLDERLRLKEGGWTAIGDLCSSCDLTTNLDGQFLMDRSTNALIMTQSSTKLDSTIVKKLVLYKEVDPDATE